MLKENDKQKQSYGNYIGISGEEKEERKIRTLTLVLFCNNCSMPHTLHGERKRERETESCTGVWKACLYKDHGAPSTSNTITTTTET